MSRNFTRVFVLMSCLLPAAPVPAQEDPEMEMQRCIWRCLADSPGAASAQYQACVDRVCTGQDSTQQDGAQPAPVSGGWTNTGARRGGPQMASVTTGASTLAFACQPGKPAVLGIDGLPGPSRGIVVSIDGRDFTPPFALQDDTHYTVVMPGSALMSALMAGNGVQVRNPAGNSVSNFTLRGSTRAIMTAMSRCGMAR